MLHCVLTSQSQVPFRHHTLDPFTLFYLPALPLSSGNHHARVCVTSVFTLTLALLVPVPVSISKFTQMKFFKAYRFLELWDHLCKKRKVLTILFKLNSRFLKMGKQWTFNLHIVHSGGMLTFASFFMLLCTFFC